MIFALRNMLILSHQAGGCNVYKPGGMTHVDAINGIGALFQSVAR
jgi:hypothetical protein